MDFGLKNLPAVLLALLVIVAVVASSLGYGLNACQKKKEGKEVAKIDAVYTGLVKADAVARRTQDSLYFFTQGRRYERALLADSLSHHAPATRPLPRISDLPHGA